MARYCSKATPRWILCQMVTETVAHPFFIYIEGVQRLCLVTRRSTPIVRTIAAPTVVAVRAGCAVARWQHNEDKHFSGRRCAATNRTLHPAERQAQARLDHRAVKIRFSAYGQKSLRTCTGRSFRRRRQSVQIRIEEHIQAMKYCRAMLLIIF